MRSESRPLIPDDHLEGLRHMLAVGRKRLSDWRRRRLGLRGILLYVLSAPLAFAALIALAKGDFSSVLASGGAFGMLAVGARLNRRGMLERLLASERHYTRAMRFPFQYLAVVLVTLGTILAAHTAVGQDLLVSMVFGGLAAVGFHLAYGLPSLAKLWAPSQAAVRDTSMLRALEQAERRLIAIEKAALSIRNQELERRLRRIAAQGRGILEMLEQRPGELFRARRFLNVYLEGAERVAIRYARTHRLSGGRALEANFRNVLTQIESAFERQRAQLLKQDEFDLDVQIEVLRKQLQNEGIG